MSRDDPRQRKPDAATLKGTGLALHYAFGNPMLPDAAADNAFAGMINRLRGEPGSHKGKSQ